MQPPLSVAEELIALTIALATKRDLDALLGAVVGAACRLMRAEGGRIFVMERTGRALNCAVAQNERAPEAAMLQQPIPVYHDGLRYNLEDPNVYCAVTGKIVGIDDIYAYTGFNMAMLQAHDRRVGFRTTSLVATPLWSVEGVTLGVLQLFNLDDQPAGDLQTAEERERLLGSFAAHAAVAISNARLFEENRALIRQLDRKATELAAENSLLRDAVTRPGLVGVVGDSPPMRSAIDLMRRAAASRVAVLLLGETGTGKEVFARAIHEESDRRDKPFVAQNCAALPEGLLESELFGHKRGAFSGAVTDKRGLVQEAHGGTLFLDEVGDMPLPLQAKLLRLLEDGSMRRVGDTKTEKVDVRVVAATNADLKQKISSGSFREDLYYRLGVFPLTLPPLRERNSDVPKLIEHFLARAAAAHRRAAPRLTQRALDALSGWRYPGNVRELKNILERAVLLIDEGEQIDLRHLPAEIGQETVQQTVPVGPLAGGAALRTSVQQFEAVVIEARLRETGWNQSRAAGLLQISRRSLVEKLRRYAIQPPQTLRRGPV